MTFINYNSTYQKTVLDGVNDIDKPKYKCTSVISRRFAEPKSF